MSCNNYESWLGDAVDGTLEPDRQAEIDAHLQACAACRELVSDLKEIRAAAAALDRLTPSPAVWNAIVAKVGATSPATARRSMGAGVWGWNAALASAAALVLLLGAAAWFGVRPGQPAGGGSPDAIARAAASELQLAEQHYLNAIASLETLSARRDTTLDPDVAAEIAASLRAIDTAITDSRAALRTNPESFVAQTSLLEALRMKVALLQDTVTLMNARS